MDGVPLVRVYRVRANPPDYADTDSSPVRNMRGHIFSSPPTRRISERKLHMTPEDEQGPSSSSTSSPPDHMAHLPTSATDASGISRRSLLRGAAASATTLAALGGLALPTNVVAASLPKVTSASPVVEFPRAGRLREYWF